MIDILRLRSFYFPLVISVTFYHEFNYVYVLILSSKIVLGIRGEKRCLTFKVTRNVTEDLIDNNNHMHDAYYNMIFRSG